MKLIAETERLILREFILEDVDELFKLNENKEVVKYTGDKSFKNMEEAKEVLINEVLNHYEQNGIARWAVHEKKSGRFLGWCGLKNVDNTIDLGYRFNKKYWGKGFAAEAAQATLDYGFQELKYNEIIARVAKENLASVQVLEKLGFKYLKSTGNCNGFPADWYMLTQEDWAKLKK